MKIAAVGARRRSLRAPAVGSPGHGGGAQLRSLRGAGVVALDDDVLSVEVDVEEVEDELSVDVVAAGAAGDWSVVVVVVVVVSLGAVLLSVLDAVAAGAVLLGIVLVSAGACVVVVVVVDDASVVWATARPIAASRPAAAATADNFF